ncbi:hypothetical protein RHMOL_Rhmol12G0028200 [Rhododendron molle]|uniref:Uncharacterized protein n=1 Tax=Rhododendron molle TaxID=49168 RepID=A0ACC0LEV4_RHOML|nr:hypothetical protein RHMOL_Rhmol12G0028200 [Rhododendron molle]
MRGVLSFYFSCVLVNIYGPCCSVERRMLWERSLNSRTLFSGPWCLGGDLIEIRNSQECQACSRRDTALFC